MPIEHISDTARWVAVYRAMETDRPDAIFRDPYARQLAGERGEEIVNTLKYGRRMAWAMVVRTAVFDEIVLQTIARENVDLVLNLAAGLDTRAWRLNLPPSLRWVDVDLAEILAYKTDMLRDQRPACVYDAINTDLNDATARQALIARLGTQAKRILVITEGLLIYLTSDQVGALARDLRAAPSVGWWLTDLANPRLLEMMNKWWGRSAQAGNAPFQFAPAEGTEFFLPFGWREVHFRSSMEEAHRLRRELRMMGFWRFLMRFYSARRREEFRRLAGYVLFARA